MPLNNHIKYIVDRKVGIFYREKEREADGEASIIVSRTKQDEYYSIELYLKCIFKVNKIKFKPATHNYTKLNNC